MDTTLGAGGRAGLVLCAVVAGCLGVWSLAVAFSDLAMSRPRVALAAWEEGGGFGDYQERRRLLTRIGRAVAVNPSDADQRTDLGRFFAWHAARHPRGSQRQRFYARLAAARFEEAVAARPTWGFAWVLLAEQLDALDADEATLMLALRRGARLAPLEPRTQLKVMWLSLGRWPQLSEPHREELRAGLSHLLASPLYFRDAARIALHHGRDELVSGNLTETWQRQSFARLRGAS